MIYCIPAKRLMHIERMYTVVRKTVWQVADPSHILIFIAEGCCRFESGGMCEIASAGDVVFIPSGQTYRRSAVDDTMCKMMYVHFSIDGDVTELEGDEAARVIADSKARADKQLLDGQKMFDSYDPILYLPFVSSCRKKETLELYEDLSKAMREYRSDNGLYVVYAMCRLLSLISRDLRRQLMAGDVGSELIHIPANLKRAVWYIKQNESTHITLDSLCSYCSVSPSQMIRYFKDAFAKTPIQYINEYKINRAREMMQTSPELAIKNVGDALGFDDPHYFSRIFSAITGESPRQYKTRVTNFGKKADCP